MKPSRHPDSEAMHAALALQERNDRSTPAVATVTLEEIYRQHFDYVYRQAARLGGPGFDAEDAAQEVFIIVARRLHTYEQSAAMTTWLFGITFNVVRHSWRRARLVRLFLKEREHETEEAPASPDAAEVQEARQIAESILARMRPKHREVLVLSEFEGLGGDQIAALLGIKIETVWSRLHQARKEFARRLEKRGLRRNT
jgi:RNA polymerase sigma-70 factor (ECF subfamily)